MSTFGRMAYLSSVASLPNVIGFMKRIADRKGWKRDEGCTYYVFEEGLPLAQHERKVLGVDGMDIVLVEVIGELAPHFHRECDVVLTAHLSGGAEAEAYIDGVGWVSVKSGQTFVSPRGEVHGFRKRNKAGQFLLVNIESPGLKDDDTEYVQA